MQLTFITARGKGFNAGLAAWCKPGAKRGDTLVLEVSWGLPPYINAGNYPLAMVMELAVATLSVLLVVGAVRRFLLKRNKTTVLIGFVFAGIFLAALMTGLGKALVIGAVLTYQEAVFTFYFDGLALMCVMISNTAFFIFTLDVFYDLPPRRKRASIVAYLVLEAVAVAGGIAALATRNVEPLFKNLLNGVVLGMSFYTYILLVVKAFSVASRVAGREERQGMRLIGLSGMLIVAFFVTFALDVLNPFGLGNISPFYFVAWSVAGIAVLVTYRGYFGVKTPGNAGNGEM